MKQYGYWQALVMSFYSRDLYRDVGQNWGARVALYALLLLAICWIPLMGFTQLAVNVAYPQMVEGLVPQLPVVTIKNGIAQTPENRPYMIMDIKHKKVVAIVDTSGKYTTIENQPFDFLVTKTALMSKDNRTGEIKIHQFPSSLNYVADPVSLSQTIGSFLHWLWLILWPVCVLCSFVWRLLMSLLYALVGKVYANCIGVQIRYEQILALAMVSMTPYVVLSMILKFTPIPGQFLIGFIIIFGYLFFAINAFKEKAPKLLEAPKS